MHPRTRELLAQLDTERAALRDAVHQVPAPLREQRSSPDSSSVAEVLEHLALIENRVLQPLGELTQKHPVLGTLNLYQWVLFVAAHEARHTAQIREIVQAVAER
jgi:hypothetical protein